VADTGIDIQQQMPHTGQKMMHQQDRGKKQQHTRRQGAQEREDLREVLKGFADADGVDLAFECSGAPPALGACLEALRRQGTLVQVGLFGRRFENDYEQVAMKELTVLGSYGHVYSSWRRAIALIAAGKIQTRPLITAILPLARWEEAFRRSEAKDGVKFLLAPGA